VIRRGLLHWVRLLDDKRRPALIISPPERNQSANRVLVLPISTQLRFVPWHVPLAAGEGNLPRSSVIKCEDIQPVRRELIEPSPIGGPLSSERMREVEDAVLTALGIRR
jgi:mRNA-degrading endonuclease toxin of MazEF toxin-antitoxin module